MKFLMILSFRASDWKLSNLSEITTTVACVSSGIAELKAALIWISTTDDFRHSDCLVTSNTIKRYRSLFSDGAMLGLLCVINNIRSVEYFAKRCRVSVVCTFLKIVD